MKPAPPSIELVTFDAVGTVFTLRESVGETYARAARRYGVELPAWRVDDGFRRILARAPAMVFPEAADAEVPGLERAWWRARVRETFKATDQTVRFTDFDAFFDELFAHYAQAGAWQCAEGAIEILAALAADGRRLALASNFDHRLGGVLQGLGLDGFFEAAWTPARALAAKPDTGFFTTLLAHLRVGPEAALHVGDDPGQDAEAARAAGLHAFPLVPPATLHALPAHLRALERGEA